MELLPKTDGCAIMISAFVSREFGFGLELNNDELQRVNKQRQSHEWGRYISKEEAIAVNGTDKKRFITDLLTLVQFFYVSINEESYWNYNHMALQVEDVYNALSIKCSKCRSKNQLLYYFWTGVG